ncbi:MULTISPECIES: cupin domain-containing protein [unclassified Paludibacterium]|uniref:cupin domain-containing protein n=1 Tax=unclassified Paludibacterium TaxID=2618429 RepID=UPI001C056AAB|nr:cupin domain-containing protein [Paludibacterium sp. B53371]BEV73836.1 hypothetical protein THUN1379_33180 [Paludibacterium sp. THUN1379]
MSAFILHRLPSLGRSLMPDSDHLLTQLRPSQLLLINLRPGQYAFESHVHHEFLLCLEGTLVLEDEQGRACEARTGEMIEIPSGLSHRFAAGADAVIATIAQSS